MQREIGMIATETPVNSKDFKPQVFPRVARGRVIAAALLLGLTCFSHLPMVRHCQAGDYEQLEPAKVFDSKPENPNLSRSRVVSHAGVSRTEPVVTNEPTLAMVSTQQKNVGASDKTAEAETSAKNQKQSTTENTLRQLAKSKNLTLGKTADLIAQFDPAKQIQSGLWKIENESLISGTEGYSKLILPYKFPENYILRLRAKKKAGNNNLNVRVRLGGHNTLVVIDGWRGRMSGLHHLDNVGGADPKNETRYLGGIVGTDKQAEILIVCHEKSILVTVDGKTIIDWRGDPSRLSEEGVSDPLKAEQLLIETANASWELSRFTITPILDEPRLAVPAEGEIKKAEKELETTRNIDFRVTRRNEKLPFAQKLRAMIVAETKPANRYALYSHALTNASEAGDLKLALEIADDLAGEFDVSSWDLKQQAITEVAKVRRNPQSYYELALASSELAWKASDEYRYAEAVKLLETALRLAKQSRVQPLITQLISASDRFESWQKSYETVKGSHEAVQRGTAGAADHLAWGRFLCFVIHNWEAGLPHLQQGDDRELARLAAEELEHPVEFQPIVQLVQKWLALANQYSGSDRESIETHALLLSMNAIPLAEDNQLPLIEQYARKLFGGATLINTTSQPQGVLIGGANANPPAEATIEFWMRTTDTRGGCLLKREKEPHDSIGVIIENGLAVLHANGSFYREDANSKAYVSDGQWHHLAVSKVGDHLSLFVDGAPVAELTPRAGFPKRNDSQWRLGHHKWMRGDSHLAAQFARIRLSGVSRYHTRFIPERDYEANQTTLLMIE